MSKEITNKTNEELFDVDLELTEDEENVKLTGEVLGNKSRIKTTKATIKSLVKLITKAVKEV